MFDWAERIHNQRHDPNGDVWGHDHGGARQGGWKAVALVVGIVLMAWLLGFVTGLAPWIGHRDYAFRAGALDASSDLEIGTRAMLLFRGQTAFVDYRVSGEPGEAIYVDVTPWPGIRHSERLRRVSVGDAGRAEFPIHATGVYHFKATPTPSSYRDTLRFTATWGAR